MSGPVLVIGAGGHARVVIDALLSGGADILGIVDIDPARHGAAVLGVSVLGGEEIIGDHGPGSVALVNGIGSVADTGKRREAFLRYHEQGYRFRTIVHASAVLAVDAALGEGAQVLAGAVVQTGAAIGANAIVNTGACVDHDCRIGAHVHIAPGATLSGNVTVADGCHVGCGATLIQGITVGAGSVVGAGAAVVADVEAGVTVLGVPARPVDA